MNDPPSMRAADVPPRERPSLYPEPFASRMAGRVKRSLGDAFGLRNFGVQLVTLAPGAITALRHAHTRQDELFYVLRGHPTLVTNAGETPLEPGTCGGFPADGGDAWHVVNRSDAEAELLVIGDRSDGDSASYPDDDLRAVMGEDGAWRFEHRDGTPY